MFDDPLGSVPGRSALFEEVYSVVVNPGVACPELYGTSHFHHFLPLLLSLAGKHISTSFTSRSLKGSGIFRVAAGR